jgi:hypothetical protein
MPRFIALFDMQRVTTLYRSLLHHTHTLVSIVTSSMPLLGNGFQRRTLPFFWVPEISLCLSYQLLTATAYNWAPEVMWLSHSLINQLTPLRWLTDWQIWLLVTYRHGPHKKHSFSVCGQLLFSGSRRKHYSFTVCYPLPNNGRCTVAYLAVTPSNGSTCYSTLLIHCKRIN